MDGVCLVADQSCYMLAVNMHCQMCDEGMIDCQQHKLPPARLHCLMDCHYTQPVHAST